MRNELLSIDLEAVQDCERMGTAVVHASVKLSASSAGQLLHGQAYPSKGSGYSGRDG